jgi:hypothetical protein
MARFKSVGNLLILAAVLLVIFWGGQYVPYIGPWITRVFQGKKA